MANKTFHSSTVTFLDRTDERKLEVYISSNHPTVQIKNQNTNEYTPDWSTTNLTLEATRSDSKVIIPCNAGRNKMVYANWHNRNTSWFRGCFEYINKLTRN